MNVSGKFPDVYLCKTRYKPRSEFSMRLGLCDLEKMLGEVEITDLDSGCEIILRSYSSDWTYREWIGFWDEGFFLEMLDNGCKHVGFNFAGMIESKIDVQ
jgi:hypothetical protein